MRVQSVSKDGDSPPGLQGRLNALPRTLKGESIARKRKMTQLMILSLALMNVSYAAPACAHKGRAAVGFDKKTYIDIGLE